MNSMTHSFIAAKLWAQRSAYWTSYFGVQAAARLVTHPFIALRVRESDLREDHFSATSKNFLFIVSPHKPTGNHSTNYVVVLPTTQKEGRSVSVHPPLHVQGQTLYIHTIPRLLELPWEAEENTNIATARVAGPHQLDDESFRNFRRWYQEDQDKRRERVRRGLGSKRSSGGQEVVEDDWDTWSGEPGTEGLNDPRAYVFDYLPLKDIAVLCCPAVYQDLTVYKQYVLSDTAYKIDPLISHSQVYGGLLMAGCVESYFVVANTSST